MVSCTPSLDNKIPIGFIVLWFHGFMHSISGQIYVDRFLGFMVSWFHGFMQPSPNSEMLIVFMVWWFHGLSLHALGFLHSISGQQDTGRFLDFNILLSRIVVHETTKPIVISMSMSMSRDGVHKTMKS